MDVIIARPLIMFIMILLVMVFISLPFLEPGSPEFWVDIISLFILLLLLGIISYDVRRSVKKTQIE